MRFWERIARPSATQLALPIELEDGRIPHAHLRVSRLLIAGIAVAAIWAAFAQIREFAIAPGEVIPVGSVRVIAHPDGGEVAEVYVHNGQFVDAGQPLVRFKPVAATSDLNQMLARQASLQLQQNALTALIDGTEPDFASIGATYPELAEEQAGVYESRLRHFEQQRLELTARISRREADLNALLLEAESLKNQYTIKEEELAIIRPLLESGLESRRAFLASQFDYERARAAAIQIDGQIASARQLLSESRSALSVAEADFQRMVNAERADAGRELAEVSLQIEKYEDRVNELVVQAPEPGVVDNLAFQQPGGVLLPGDPVALLVPTNAGLAAEVRIDPKDVGHIGVGDVAELKLTSFDSDVYGTLSGTVDTISPTTYVTEDGSAFYKAVIALGSAEMGAGSKRGVVLPGMIVEARIVGGTKSLVRYMLKPVFEPLDVAFSER